MSVKSTPIRRKLMTIIMLTTTAALLLTCASFFVYELLTFRHTAVQQLSTQGEIVAANSTAALAFDNQGDALEVLKALKAERHIVAAGLYDKEGKLFSQYPADLPRTAFPKSPEADGYRFRQSYLMGFEPVVQGQSNRLGTLYLKSDMGAMTERFRLYGLIAGLVIVFSLIVAYAISRLLQRQITQPILSLAGVAKAVSDDADYSVRATKLSGDELGMLTDAFNQMLVRIQDQNEELIQNEQRLRAVLDSATSAVIVSDAEGRIIDWNSRAEKMFGWTRGEAVRKNLVETITASTDRQNHQRILELIFSSKGPGASQFVEMTALRKDGTEFQAEISCSLPQIGGVPALCSFVTDLTDRQQSEAIKRKNFELEEMNHQIQEANRLKSEFLANMSHELRTPLNGIIGFSEFLVEGKPGPLNPKQLEYLGDIRTSGRHLLHLINDVLDLAKVEAGKMEFNPESFSLIQVIDEVRAVTRPLAQEKSIAVTVDVEPGLDEAVLDQQRFKQVLYNLLSNAIKFTDTGSVEISVTSLNRQFFKLSVTDTGIGIKPEDIQRLFREFEQLESGSARRYQGTGLGLALSQKIVELQGGLIRVESKVGEGSTFTVVLPLNAHGTNSMKPSLILVVDDNATNLKLAVDVLEFEGYDVLSAADGESAQEIIKTTPPDLILMDLGLPGIDGLTLTRLLKADEQTKHIIVIAFTAFAMKGDEAKALEAGCDGYLSKPIDIQVLCTQVAEYLSRSSNGTTEKAA